MIDHDAIAEMLPDYAAGTLDDADDRLVAAHLESCVHCRNEFMAALETLTLLTESPRPRPAVKQALLQRLAREAHDRSLAPIPDTATSAADPAKPKVGMRSGPGGSFPWRWTWAKPAFGLGLAAIVLAVVIGLVVWNQALERQLDEQEEIAALLTEPTSVHALTDRDIGSASGTIYTDPTANVAIVVAHDLPELRENERFQVWLFTRAGDRVSAGLFTSDGAGIAQALVTAPAPFSQYWAVGITVEPETGSPAPTSPLIVGGWIQ